MKHMTISNDEAPPISRGGQNILIKAVIDQFFPRYTPGGTVCYRNDAGEKITEEENDYLSGLNLKLDAHGKMPDVIVHLKDKNWLAENPTHLIHFDGEKFLGPYTP